MYLYIHTYSLLRTHTARHTHTHYMYTHIHIHTHIHTLYYGPTPPETHTHTICIHTHVHIHIHTHAYDITCKPQYQNIKRDLLPSIRISKETYYITCKHMYRSYCRETRQQQRRCLSNSFCARDVGGGGVEGGLRVLAGTSECSGRGGCSGVLRSEKARSCGGLVLGGVEGLGDRGGREVKDLGGGGMQRLDEFGEEKKRLEEEKNRMEEEKKKMAQEQLALRRALDRAMWSRVLGHQGGYICM